MSPEPDQATSPAGDTVRLVLELDIHPAILARCGDFAGRGEGITVESVAAWILRHHHPAAGWIHWRLVEHPGPVIPGGHQATGVETEEVGELRRALEGMLEAPLEPAGHCRPDGPGSGVVDACNDAVERARRVLQKSAKPVS